MSNGGLRFKDKVAVVTGGCCGVGRGIVDVLAEHGGKVAVLDIYDEVGDGLKSINVAGELFYIHCDLRHEEEIKEAIELVVKKYGRIDCLVNNVGTNQGTKPIDDITVESFKELLNLNLVSYFTASKGGTVSLTKALVIDEAKNGVRVNCVSPSNVDTPLFRQVIRQWGDEDEQVKKLASFSQLGRISQPREIGMAVLFLAVYSTFTTGVDLMCTGGSEIGYGVKIY